MTIFFKKYYFCFLIIIGFVPCLAYEETPTVMLEVVLVNSSERTFRGGFRSQKNASSSYHQPSSYNVPACYASYNGSYYASLSSVDFQQAFQQVADVSEILEQYPLYAFPHFLEFARTLPDYDTYMLTLHDKIQHDKTFRKQTAYMPYFEYSFGLFTEKSGFHDFVKAEAQRIIDAQKQNALHVNKQQQVAPRKGTLDVAHSNTMDSLRNNCSQKINISQGFTAERLNNRVNAIDQTRKNNGACFDYVAQVKYYADEHEKAFQNTYGTYLDCQLHKELIQTRSTMRQLERNYVHNPHVQNLAPIVYQYTTQAKNTPCPLTAFEFSDFCHTVTQVLTHGIHVLYDASSAVGKGAWKGVNEFASIERWKDMASGALQLGLLFVTELGQEDALHYAMVFGAMSEKNSDFFMQEAGKYCAQTCAQQDAINQCAKETYQKIKAMSWQEIVEHGAELGTTMILDTLALNAVNGFGRAASNVFIKQLNNALESGALLTEQYAVEVAGFGKLIVEEGAEAATKVAAGTLKNDATFFAKSTQPVSQQIKNQITQVKWSENIVQKIRNVGDDILDVMEKAGGHTLEKHVAKTHDDLLLRAMRDTSDTISSFSNKRIALNAIKESLKYHAEEIASWLVTNPSLDKKKVLEFLHPYQVGAGVIKGKKNKLQQLMKSKMVLLPDPTNDFGFKIVTCFPV